MKAKILLPIAVAALVLFGSLNANFTYAQPDRVEITFSAPSLGDDAQGVVLTVDGANYTVSDLPVTFVWNISTTHTFKWHSPIQGDSRTYAWISCSGLTNERYGELNVTESGQVKAVYQVVWEGTTASDVIEEIVFGAFRWIFIIIVIVISFALLKNPWASFIGMWALLFLAIFYVTHGATMDIACAMLLIGMGIYLLINFLKKGTRW